MMSTIWNAWISDDNLLSHRWERAVCTNYFILHVPSYASPVYTHYFIFQAQSHAICICIWKGISYSKKILRVHELQKRREIFLLILCPSSLPFFLEKKTAAVGFFFNCVRNYKRIKFFKLSQSYCIRKSDEWMNQKYFPFLNKPNLNQYFWFLRNSKKDMIFDEMYF